MDLGDQCMKGNGTGMGNGKSQVTGTPSSLGSQLLHQFRERTQSGEQVGGQEHEFGSRCVEYERPVGHPGGVPIRNIGLELSGEVKMRDSRLENHE